MSPPPRSVGATAAALLVALAVRADDLPSPDALWLGDRIVPPALVQGFRHALEEEVLDRVLGTRVAAVDQPAVRARARTAMAPLLDEAFAPELLSGPGAQFLAGHYTAGELRALREREESPLGRKLRAFDRAAEAIVAATPAARDEAREVLARRTFTDAERRELEAFAASPLGRKGEALALDLAGFFVERLEQRYAAVRSELEPRLVNVAEAVLLTAGK